MQTTCMDILSLYFTYNTFHYVKSAEKLLYFYFNSTK